MLLTSDQKSRIAPAPRHATRSMTTDAARQAVFNTSELLEQIILHLPMKNIFGIQRVCKHFNEVIVTSPEIQIKHLVRLQGDRPKETWVKTTLKGTRNGHQEDVRFRKVEANEVAGRRGFYTPAALNPLLEMMPQDSPFRLAKWWSTSPDWCEAVTMNFSQGHLGSHPSFLKTYITDPPCQKAEAQLVAHYLINPNDDPKEESVRGTVTGDEVTSDQGLTIGDILLAHGDIDVCLHATGLGDAYTTDGQLEDVSQEIAPMVMEDGLSPILTLQLLDAAIPTEEEWRAVSSEHTEASS
jgi:hypothetical protein